MARFSISADNSLTYSDHNNSILSDRSESDYSPPSQQQQYLSSSNNNSPRSPLMQVSDNNNNSRNYSPRSIDSDDNTESSYSQSPVSALNVTNSAKKQQLVRSSSQKENINKLEPNGYDWSNFKVNVPLKQNPALKSATSNTAASKPRTPSPLKNRVGFAPSRSVVSYSKASSPSKLFEASLLTKNRREPGSFIEQDDSPSPRKSKEPPLQNSTPISHHNNNEWEDEFDEDDYYYHYGQQQLAKYPPTPHSHTNNNDFQSYRNVFWDPQTPSTLSSWIQITFNVMVASSILYFFYLFVSTVRHDIDMKVEEYSAEILNEMSLCSKEYINNNCMPGKRVPALEKMCNSWEKCMNQDPAIVGRAKVGAEAFGEIVESFTKPISWKTIIFVVCFVGGTTLISNLSLMYSRRNLNESMKSNKDRQKKRKNSPHTPSSSGNNSFFNTPFYTPRGNTPSNRRRRQQHHRSGVSPSAGRR